MSGEPRAEFLGAEMVRLVSAIPVVQTLVRHQLVVIGGLAVLARLSTPLRSTSDLDTVEVFRRGERGALELLLEQDDAKPADAAGVVFPTRLGSVKVDVISVDPRVDRPPPEDPNDALYELSHAWAFDTAGAMIMIASQHSSVSEPAVRAEALVAEPGPLIAMKLQSVENRTRAKEAVDLLDIVALVSDRATGPRALASLTEADPHLVGAAARHVDVHFFERRERTLGLVRDLPEGGWVSPSIVSDVAEALRAALEG